MTPETHAAIETIVRMESARLIAGLARYTGDLRLAEELAQDAVVAALEQWPQEGVPRNAGAWLMTTAEIARAYLVSEVTIAQRIVRAKKTPARARVPFEVPGPAERGDRLSSVLEVIYLIFNEGYSATAGDDWTRPALCQDAVRLGRVLAELMPAEPEVHGLVSLMEIQASRINARAGPSGRPVLLLDQDRARWDRLLINRGLAALARAEQLGGAEGPYALQAAIAACHARAFRPEDTAWARIAGLYAVLAGQAPSPVVELNRAVAVSMAYGPQAGLDLVDELTAEPALRDYHLLPSVRGDLLMKLGRPDEAQAEFERAAALTRNAAERELSAERAAAAAAAQQATAGTGRDAGPVRRARPAGRPGAGGAGPGSSAAWSR